MMGFDDMTVRFFLDAGQDTHEVDYVTFEAEDCDEVRYERHTVFANGSRQVCLTRDASEHEMATMFPED